MVLVLRIPPALKAFIKKVRHALHVQLTVQTVNRNHHAQHVLMVSRWNQSVMEEFRPVTVCKNVAMEEDSNLIVMMEIIKTVMDVQLTAR